MVKLIPHIQTMIILLIIAFAIVPEIPRALWLLGLVR